MPKTNKMILACAALIVSGACSNQPATNNTSTTAKPSGPAAAVQTTSYQGEGTVKGLNPKLPAIEIDHAEIVGLMPAMQMEFPVTERALLDGLAVNDRIDFTVESGTGEMKVTAIKKK